MSLICQPTSEDIKLYIIISSSCVKVEEDVLGSPSVIVLIVSGDVKHR